MEVFFITSVSSPIHAGDIDRSKLVKVVCRNKIFLRICYGLTYYLKTKNGPNPAPLPIMHVNLNDQCYRIRLRYVALQGRTITLISEYEAFVTRGVKMTPISRPGGHCSTSRNPRVALRNGYQCDQAWVQRCVFDTWSQPSGHRRRAFEHRRSIRKSRDSSPRSIESLQKR